MREIKLLRGQITQISDCDYDRIIKALAPNTNLYLHPEGYVQGSFIINEISLKIRLHRFILNAKDGEDVDHIDHNTLNNQRENLRICSASENAQNKNGWKFRSSGIKYKGVYFNRGKFQVRIGLNKKILCFGSYNTQEEAALIYNNTAKKYFGNFARLNIINATQTSI